MYDKIYCFISQHEECVREHLFSGANMLFLKMCPAAASALPVLASLRALRWSTRCYPSSKNLSSREECFRWILIKEQKLLYVHDLRNLWNRRNRRKD